MTNVIERGRFSELGDQQLLEQTRRLAANQRCIDVHILDHLDEIDRRGLALRRGFSSLFDYAVRELHFSDAAAQRRIQAMRLCRRHGWVRACLQSGALSMTSAAQFETTFAGAERAERQSQTGHRNGGQGRGRDQDHDCAGGTRQLGLPAAPGEADEQGDREQRSAPGVAPPAGGCTGDVATGNTPAVPVASRAGAQAPGAAHAGPPLPRPELNGNASPFPAPSCAPVAAHGAGAGAGAGSAAPSSDEGPAPLLLPPTDLPASASGSTPVPEPVVAPAESRHTASRAPEPPRDDPFAELSPGTVSAAPLLHPQRQRELIEQAAGMSTRQVASLLAAAAPEVLPPRDTLRAVAPDRYTLKMSIDQECEQGLRRLKDLMSHVDPRMSWGDLVARLVRDAVARHDPRGGGSRQRRRRSAGSAGASPRRAPKETRGAGPAGGPAQRVGESSGPAPNWTGAAGLPGRLSAQTNPRGGRRTGHVPPWRRWSRLGAQGARFRRHRATPPLPKGRTRSGCWPTPLHRASQHPPRLWMAPVQATLHRARPPLLRRRSRHPRHGWMALAQVPFHRARPPLLRRRSSRPAPWRLAPMPAQVCRARRSPLRRRRRHLACPLTADRPTHQPGQGAAPRRLASLRAQACRARRSPLRRRSRHLACPLTADRPKHQPGQGAAPRRLASLRAQACRARRSPLRRRSRHSACPRRWTARSISRGSGAPNPRTYSPPPPIPAAAPHSRGGPAPRLATRRWTLLLSRAALRAALHLFPSAADRPPVAGRRGRWPGAVQPQSLMWSPG